MDEIEIDRDALLQTFLAEAEETFVQMEQGLVALEARPGDDQLLNALFRHAHTVKGAAGLVGFDAVRDLAHDLEDVLERLRKRTLTVSDGLVTLLLQSVDVLRGAVADAAAGGTAASEKVAAFRRGLAEAASAAGQAAPGGAAFARLLAIVLVALGIWVAAAPGSVPGLTQPSGGMQMPMGMQP